MGWCREDGSIAPAVPIIAMSLLLIGGLGIDGSRQLNARGEATAFAEEAARAGAEAVNVNETVLTLDLDQARQRVDQFCSDVLRRDQVEECRFVRFEPASAADPRLLIVVTEVRTRIKTSLLSMIGVQELSASAEAKARPFEGVSQAELGVDVGAAPALPLRPRPSGPAT